MTVEGLLEKRGGCDGRFASDLDAAERRVMWDSWNACLIDLPPVVPVDKIIGQGLPFKAVSAFRGQFDEYGHADWMDVQSCPLKSVDPLSPKHEPGWLIDVYESAASIAADLPAHWHIKDPTPLLKQAIITLKSEGDSAQIFRSENNEDW